jgi:nitronate monooxygenase
MSQVRRRRTQQERRAESEQKLPAASSMSYTAATTESAAPQGWKDAVVAAGIDDIGLTSEFTGLPTSMIGATAPATAPSAGDGFHMSRLSSPDRDGAEPGDVRYCAACVDRVLTVAALVGRVEQQMRDAEAAFLQSRR